MQASESIMKYMLPFVLFETYRFLQVSERATRQSVDDTFKMPTSRDTHDLVSTGANQPSTGASDRMIGSSKLQYLQREDEPYWVRYVV